MGRQSNYLQRRAFLTPWPELGIGVALGIRPWGRAAAQDAISPVPIPGGSPAIAELGASSSMLYRTGCRRVRPTRFRANYYYRLRRHGWLGLYRWHGHANKYRHGESRELTFVGNDMRFMKGAYRGTDGQIHQGAFAFI